MRSNTPPISDGFIHELLPLIKDGFVMLRSILDVMIERIEEAEKNRQIDTRKEIYTSIIDALESEIENMQEEETGSISPNGKVEVIEAVIAVLSREMEELDSKAHRKGKRPKRVKID